MKKRVVAVLLSLSMCMATMAEATIASAADFSAEIAVAEDNEEPVADVADNGEDVEDSTVTIEDGDVSDTEQTDEDTEPETTPAADVENTEVDFGSEEDFSSDISVEIQDALDMNDAEAAGSTYPGENVVSSTEAVLSYHRWVAKSVDGTLKWQLHKYTGSSTTAASESEKQAEIQDTADDTVAAEAITEEAAAVEDTSEDTVQETETTPAADPEEATDEDVDAAGSVNANYYTAADGLIQITTLDKDGNTVFTAKYAFDKDGYLITGKSLVGTNGNDSYYFATADEVEITHPDVDSEFSGVVSPYNSELGQMQSDKWIWNGSVFSYYNKDGVYEAKNEGIYRINNEYYYLDKNGKPFTGEKETTYNNRQGLYWFKSASGKDEIPGKMARSTWIGINNNRWRYFGSDGRYVKKGVGA